MEPPAFDSLQRAIGAPLLTRTHPDFDGARRVWNGMIDRCPLLIVQPESAAEVSAAIAFAREHELPLSVKGGGHSVAGQAICDDGLVIDLSRMGAVHVDPRAHIATVQGGATLRGLDAASQAHGLATTAGIYRDTGVVGLALGGGVGLLMRRFGLTCDNLDAAEVVTADGRVLEANVREQPDLFWALRGGGGNFGVVTRLDFRLHPLTHVFGGKLTYGFADALAIGHLYRDVMTDAPEELQAYLTYSTGEGEKTASVALCHCGRREEGEAVLDRFRALRHPVAEHLGWIPYLQMQQHWDDAFPAGRLHFWKSSFLATISEDAIRLGHEVIASSSTPGNEIIFEPMGGAISRVAADATAFAERDAASTLIIVSGGTDPGETAARIGWARATWSAFQPYAKPSAYVNYLDDGDEHRTEALYGSNYRRLVEIKRSYDPDNVFRHNTNIRP